MTVPFSHMVPSYPERQVHWFGRAHLMKIKNKNFEDMKKKIGITITLF